MRAEVSELASELQRQGTMICLPVGDSSQARTIFLSRCGMVGAKHPPRRMAGAKEILRALSNYPYTVRTETGPSSQCHAKRARAKPRPWLIAQIVSRRRVTARQAWRERRRHGGRRGGGGAGLADGNAAFTGRPSRLAGRLRPKQPHRRGGGVLGADGERGWLVRS